MAWHNSPMFLTAVQRSLFLGERMEEGSPTQETLMWISIGRYFALAPTRYAYWR